MKAKSSKAYRWHPLFIRWCLNIMLTSSKTYDIIRESGFITLPSKRTLRDYTHWFKSNVGFQDEVDGFLMEEVKIDGLKDWQRYTYVGCVPSCMCH